MKARRQIIRARCIDYGKGKRQLLIMNIGKCKACNLTVELPNEDEIYASNPSFPVEYKELLPQASREIVLALVSGNDEANLVYHWDDEITN